MITLLLHVLRLLPFIFGGHRQLAVENLALRQQLAVYKRTTARPKLRTTDRLSFAKTSAGGQVVDLSVMTRALSELDDHVMLRLFGSSPSSLAATASSPSRTWPCASSSTSTSEPWPDPHYAGLIGFSGSCSPESGPDGGGLS